jgi:hypothetical protein
MNKILEYPNVEELSKSNRPETETEASRIRIAFSLLAFSSVLAVVLVIKPWGPTTAYLGTFLYFGLISTYIAMRRDILLCRILITCMIAGVLELYADWYIIEVKPTLIYAPEGPFIVTSPFYMPFSWAIVLFLIAVIGRWIDKKRGLFAAIFLCLLIGLIGMPTFEYLAADAGWWHYFGVRAFGNAPFYLILGHPLIMASLPLFMRIIEKRGFLVSSAAGIGLGVWIFVAFRIGLLFFG